MRFYVKINRYIYKKQCENVNTGRGFMRKFIIITIMTMTLIISGCNKKESEEEMKEQTIGSVAAHDYSVHEDIPEPYETITDKQKIILPAMEQAYNMETDYQYYLNKQEVYGSDIAETENTIFFYETYLDKSFIKMIDKETKTVQTFCNKPECRHDTSTCNGYFEKAKGMFYYNGFIYIMREECLKNESGYYEVKLNLYRVSIETQEREIAKNIAVTLTDNGTDSYSISYIQHRGYLYYIYDIGTGGEADIFYNNGSNSLYRISLDKVKGKECIANMRRTGGKVISFLHLQAAGSYVYYMIPDENGMGEVYRFNIETLKNEALNLGIIATENFVIWNGDVYYKKNWQETEVYIWHSQTGEEECFTDTKKSGYEKSSDFFVGTDYMYVTCFDGENLTGCNWLSVFDKSGEMVTELKLPVEMSVQYGGKDIFISYKGSDKEQYLGGDYKSTCGELYVFDIEDIGKEGNIFERIKLSMVE